MPVDRADIRKKQQRIARSRMVEMPIRVSASCRHDVWKSHLKQAFVATGSSEAAGFDAAERQAGIRGGDDEIVNGDEPRFEATGQRACAIDARRKNRGAESETAGMDEIENLSFGLESLKTNRCGLGIDQSRSQIVGHGFVDEETVRGDAGFAAR